MLKKVCKHKAAMTVVNQARGNFLLRKSHLIIQLYTNSRSWFTHFSYTKRGQLYENSNSQNTGVGQSCFALGVKFEKGSHMSFY